ncbi:G-type lectin S-receptor-like serine/threonine-protein kinase At4g27290 [Eucalyptus grandis]|uniref:G-type lectin S-receptor-like serine/threonine-protein kinase At4g27290 n=1 Tax=Eucalyptus grandis TaxID=71139 RepID=UPI00192EF591|nr:G-type lectin S-receptor-like serine/threonine-protein kinase At4g27290 [Eucalyptus grandis]
MKAFVALSMCLVLFTCNALVSNALDTITTNQSIQDGESLISAGETFELGFFSRGDPPKRYLGIWYKKITTMTIVWVANRVAPLADASGTLRVTSHGSLVLLDGNGSDIWLSNAPIPVRNPVAQLLDSGNLVVRDAEGSDPNNFLWQSFDYPTDTLQAGMKIGWNRTSGFNRYLKSWKSIDDPSPGNFTFQLDPNGYPQLLLKQGSDIKFRTGPWNGLRFSGTPYLNTNPYYRYEFVLNEEEMYYRYVLLNRSVTSRLTLTTNGIIQRFAWIDRTQGWMLYITSPIDQCDNYASCGAYASCRVDTSPVCRCLKGFVPRFSQELDMLDWSNGCVRRNPLDCEKDIFVKYSWLKLPDTRSSWFNESMNLQECEVVCMKKCSCMAYSNLDIRNGGSGCLLWFSELVDIRGYSNYGQDLYIRMAVSESALLPSHHKKHKLVMGLAVFFGSVFLILVLTIRLLQCKKKKMKLPEAKWDSFESGDNCEKPKEDLELPLFDLSTVARATDNFSTDNKLGEGGFGPVYKGVLRDGQEIAVKMLSRNSKQGLQEFKNEVLYVSKLQHWNLVKLLGCCIEEENLLVYEFMPNGSLDSFLFDPMQRKRLDWSTRFNIIKGIARGLLYLHQDSRLRIIHRDVKASNVLLDYEMNPKISDFGLAKSFTGNETQANTNRVVGTYGYMSPEYALDGVFSTKSDVFSYGVLVLEIVSGKRNRGFHHPDHRHNLLGHAWRLFTEGRSMKLLDKLVENSCSTSEALRSIHIGLLCVQRCPNDRPSMSTVVMMLGSDIELPLPKEPGFFIERNLLQESTSQSQPNEMTMTVLSAR